MRSCNGRFKPGGSPTKVFVNSLLTGGTREQRYHKREQCGAEYHRYHGHKTIPEADVATLWVEEEDFDGFLALPKLPDDITRLMGVLQHREVDETTGREQRGRQSPPFGAPFPE